MNSVIKESNEMLKKNGIGAAIASAMDSTARLLYSQ